MSKRKTVADLRRELESRTIAELRKQLSGNELEKNVREIIQSRLAQVVGAALGMECSSWDGWKLRSYPSGPLHQAIANAAVPIAEQILAEIQPEVMAKLRPNKRLERNMIASIREKFEDELCETVKRGIATTIERRAINTAQRILAREIKVPKSFLVDLADEPVR
jgi:hypothetical protein